MKCKVIEKIHKYSKYGSDLLYLWIAQGVGGVAPQKYILILFLTYFLNKKNG